MKVKQLNWIKTHHQWLSKVAIGWFTIVFRGEGYWLWYNDTAVGLYTDALSAQNAAQCKFNQMIEDCVE